jgi:hypothetical protein
MAGYSGTPLPKKLGIAPGANVAIVGAPDGWAAATMPDVEHATAAEDPPYDVILWFLKRRADLEAGFEAMANHLTPAGGLWIAWPKKASKVPTDITEDVLREVGLPYGVVDNKVCAVDEVWSGLRFVWRRENR